MIITMEKLFKITKDSEEGEVQNGSVGCNWNRDFYDNKSCDIPQDIQCYIF